MSSDSGLSNLSLHPVLLGDLLGRTLGHASTWVASGVLAAALVAVAVATKETLPLDSRKPFTLATANPFSNIWLLFSNGPGLRGLPRLPRTCLAFAGGGTAPGSGSGGRRPSRLLGLPLPRLLP